MTRKKKGISSGVKVGLIAIAINLITVLVYIYQTNLMREQQHASVWPYIQWQSTYNQNNGFELRVTNNGIGPALILSSTFTLEGETKTNLDSLIVGLAGTLKFPHLTGTVDNVVLPPGKSVNLIKCVDPMLAELMYINSQKKTMGIEIVYESIYKDRWKSSGTSVTELN